MKRGKIKFLMGLWSAGRSKINPPFAAGRGGGLKKRRGAAAVFNSLFSRMGFSLIELLISVSILAVLSAISIPAYNKHRKKAAASEIKATVSNIVKAVVSCVSHDIFDSCDTVKELGIFNIEGISLGGAASPNICFQFERKAGSKIYKACVAVNTSTGAYTHKYNQKFCHRDTNGGCAAPADGSCAMLNIECSAVADCPTAPSGATNKCISGTGVCTTAVCS